MLSDIEIAQGCQMRPITEVAAAAGLDAEDLELYGRYKAKLSADVWKKTADKPDGKLVLVTAINPTLPARARPPRPSVWARRSQKWAKRP